MEWYEYIWLPINIIPEEIITQYNLIAMDKNGYVYSETTKRMYGLTQTGPIGNYFITKNIAPHGY